MVLILQWSIALPPGRFNNERRAKDWPVGHLPGVGQKLTAVTDFDLICGI